MESHADAVKIFYIYCILKLYYLFLVDSLNWFCCRPCQHSIMPSVSVKVGASFCLGLAFYQVGSVRSVDLWLTQPQSGGKKKLSQTETR